MVMSVGVAEETHGAIQGIQQAERIEVRFFSGRQRGRPSKIFDVMDGSGIARS